MEKVLLFNSPIHFDEHRDVFETMPRFIRYGIASLAGFLRDRGVEVMLIDPFDRTVGEIRDMVKRFGPGLAGVPSFSTEIANAARTLKLMKEIAPSVKTMVGHSHISALPFEAMSDYPEIDIGVIGEGELTVYEIAKGNDLSTIKGIIYRQGTDIKKNPAREPIEDLSELSYPAFDLYGLENYKEKRSYLGGRVLNLPVEAARGCPFPCNFCFRTLGKTVRYKEPKRMADELEFYIEKYPVKRAAFIEGTFGINRHQTLELCAEFIKRNIHKKIKWNASVRADLDEELVEAFAVSGCRVLGLGVESGDDGVLSRCQKSITTEDIRKTVRLCKKHGIFVEAYFILGLPGDTEKTIEKTIEFAKTLEIGGANFAILVPLPGTKIFEWAENEEMGYRFLTKDYRFFSKQSGNVLENSRISRDKLTELQNRAYREFYTSDIRRFKQFFYHLNAQRAVGIAKRILHERRI